MCTLCLATGRTVDFPVVAGFTCSNAAAQSSNSLSASGPFFSNDQIAYQLTNAYWGGSDRSFNVGVGGTISVNITALTSAGQSLARNALELWSDATGLTFSFTSGSAQIEFDDTDAWSAYNWSSTSGGNITYSYVNVGTSWINYYGTGLNTYSLQTYVHEIGHALGLGHAGNYNGSASYGTHNHYANDSWQSSVMSYFSQSENTSINASYTYAITPQVADLIAIRNLYGTSGNTRTGNTTYGDGANSGDIMQTISSMNSYISYTIVDDGGIDTLDFSSSSANQTIDLREEATSSVRGYTGNLVIARGTVIENAIGGIGNDTLIGNGANNVLQGGSGNNALYGDLGNDTLYGSAGINLLNGGTGYGFVDVERIDAKAINGNSGIGISGDFDGDGFDDLFFFWAPTGTNRLFNGQGFGDFDYGGQKINKSTINGEADTPISGDFNGDGRDDLLFYWNETGQNRLFLGQNSNNFRYSGENIAPTAINDQPSDFIVSDFDGDDRDDLMVVWRDSGVTRLFAGQFDGSFRTLSTDINPKAVNGNATVVESGDFNGDGTTDLVFMWAKSGETRFFFADENGSFSYFDNLINPTAVNGSPTQMITGDFDDNSVDDISFFWGKTGVNRFFFGQQDTPGFIFRGNAIAPKAINEMPGEIIARDFNTDGVTDLAFFWDDRSQVRVFSGDQNFERDADTLNAHWFTNKDQLVFGDYDGDTFSDTFTFDPQSGANTLLSSSTTDGDDTLDGLNSGRNVYEFVGKTFGHDTITSFSTSDTLVFSKSVFADLAELTAASTEQLDGSTNVRIEVDAHNSVTVFETLLETLIDQVELI